MGAEERIAELEARVAELEQALGSVRTWLKVIYGDLLKSQYASAAAIRGDRDKANEIVREIQANAKTLQGND